MRTAREVRSSAWRGGGPGRLELVRILRQLGLIDHGGWEEEVHRAVDNYHESRSWLEVNGEYSSHPPGAPIVSAGVDHGGDALEGDDRGSSGLAPEPQTPAMCAASPHTPPLGGAGRHRSRRG
eukprot:2201979-Pyramimonas_sp.AAC.1